MPDKALTRRGFVRGFAAASLSAPLLGSAAGARQAGQSIEAFLPPGYNPDRDDCSAALEKAAAWSASHGGEPVRIGGKLLLRNVATLDRPGATLQFDGAEIRVRDDGRMGRLASSVFGQVPMGLLIKADRVSLLGRARFIGLGAPGRTGLCGMWFDQVASPRVGNFYFERMAFGQTFMCCDDVQVGDTETLLMHGTQNGGREGAGSAQVIAGCTNSRFGKLRAVQNDKPMRYLSPGVTAARAPRDNRGNHYGLVEGTGRPGSPWAQGMGIRSSVDSSFDGANVTGVAVILLIEKYDSDDAWHVGGNSFALIAGEVIDTPSSIDAGVMIDNLGKRAIGANRIETLRIKGPVPSRAPFAQTFGIYAIDGSLTVGTAEVSGFTFQISAYDSSLTIGSFDSTNAGFEVFRYGRALRGRISRMTIRSGIAGSSSNSGLIRAVDLGKAGIPPNFDIDTVSYAANGSRSGTDYIQYDPYYSSRDLRVGQITGKGKQGLRRFRTGAQ